MDRQRAEEIAQSDQLVPVNYSGRAVVINQIDKHNDIAKVYPLDNLNSALSVEISHLNEDSIH